MTTADTQAKYEAAVAAAEGPFPPVAVVDLFDMPHLECAKGHHWGSIYPEQGCPVCRQTQKYLDMGRPECITEGCTNIVECSQRAWDQGVRQCHPCFDQDQIANHQTAGPICLDEYITVLGQYPRNVRWNGWLMPVIDAWSVNAIAETFKDDEFVKLEWRDDGALLHYDLQWADEPDFEPDVLLPDDDGLYALGAGFWTWSEAPEEAPSE